MGFYEYRYPCGCLSIVCTLDWPFSEEWRKCGKHEMVQGDQRRHWFADVSAALARATADILRLGEWLTCLGDHLPVRSLALLRRELVRAPPHEAWRAITWRPTSGDEDRPVEDRPSKDRLSTATPLEIDIWRLCDWLSRRTQELGNEAAQLRHGIELSPHACDGYDRRMVSIRAGVDNLTREMARLLRRAPPRRDQLAIGI